MALRLAAPEVLIDLARVPGLADLTTAGGPTRVGAMVRQRTIEHRAILRTAAPLVAEAVPFIGHAAIRSQGTVCGSLAHADPAAELPAVALAAGAIMHLRSATGSRDVVAEEFFTGYYSTAVRADELLEAVSFPTVPPRTGTAFVEFSRRHGDFAIAGAAATVTLDAGGTITAARLALSGVASTPWLADAAAAVLLGATPPDSSGRSGRADGDSSPVEPGASRPEAGPCAEAVRAAVEAVRESVDPGSDLHATAAYRRHLAAVLTGRALTIALARAVRAVDGGRA